MVSKSTIFTLVFFFIFSMNLTAQDDCEFVRSLKWSTYQGGNGEDEVMDLYVDPNTKYIYTISRTNSTNLFPTNGDLGDGSQDKTYIQCTEHNGTLIWSTMISGLENPYSIRTNDVGEVILLGVTENPVMPGPANVPGSDKVLSGVSDLIFLKLNQNGSGIVASEFIGGNGYDYFSEDLTNFSFHDNKIYSVFSTTSTDLGVSSNSLLNTPGETYIFVYNTDTYSFEYQSYYEYSGSDYPGRSSDAITVDNDGNVYLLLWNDGDDMSFTNHYITSNALVNSYTENGFSYPPLIIILDNSFNQIYGSYFRIYDPVLACNNDPDCVLSYIPNTFRNYNFDLEVDDQKNIYIFLGGRFRDGGQSAPTSLGNISAPFYFDAFNTFSIKSITKLKNNNSNYNFEFVVVPESAWVSASGNIEIDHNKRIHYTTSSESSFNAFADGANLFTNNSFDADIFGLTYLIFSENGDEFLFGARPGDQELNNANLIYLFENEAYLAGETNLNNQQNSYSITPSWYDFNSSQQIFIQQSNFGGGDKDGFITCIHPPEYIGDNEISEFDLQNTFCADSYIHQNFGPVTGNFLDWQSGDGSDPNHVFPDISRNNVSLPHPIPGNEVIVWQKSYDGITWLDIPNSSFSNYFPDNEPNQGNVSYRRTIRICDANENNSNTADITIIGENEMTVSDGDVRYYHCPGDPTTINITVANHNGDLSWQWFNGYATTNDITPASGNNESSINAVINAGVNSGGIYRIVVTDNTTGCQAEELVTVVVPNIQMPGTASLCPGESCVEIGPNVIDQGINYEWSGPNGFSSSDPLICVSELGTYTLTAGNCPSTSMSIEVISQAHDPLLLPLENYELCQGNSSVIGLQGPEPAGYTYQWSPTFNLSSNQVTQYNPTYDPNSIPDPNPLTYTFSAIRDSDGCVFETTTEISITEAAFIKSNIPRYFCGGTALLDPLESTGDYFNWTITSTTFPGGVNGLINDPSFTMNGMNGVSMANTQIATINYPLNGTYTVDITLEASFLPLPNDCTRTRSFTFIFYESCQPGGTECPVDVSSNLSPGSGGYCSSENLTLIAENITGATYTWGITEIDGTIYNPALPPDGLFEIGPGQSQGNPLSGSSHPYNIIANIDDPLNGVAANYVEYTVTMTLPNGISCSENIGVYSSQQNTPEVDVIDNYTICAVDQGSLITGETFPLQIDGTFYNSAPNSNINWEWTNNSNQSGIVNPSSPFPEFTNQIASVYLVKAIDPISGCFDTDELTLEILRLRADAGDDIVDVCSGTIVQLNAYNGIEYNQNYQWTPPTGLNFPIGTVNNMVPDPYVNVDQDITYTLEVSNDLCSATDEVNIITSNTPPVPIQDQSFQVCQGDELQFVQEQNFLESCNGCTYNWNVINGTGIQISNSTVAEPLFQISDQAMGPIVLNVTAVKGDCGSTSGTITLNILNPDAPAVPSFVEIDCSLPLDPIIIQNYSPANEYQIGPMSELGNVFLDEDLSMPLSGNILSSNSFYVYTSLNSTIEINSISDGCKSEAILIDVVNNEGFDVNAGEDLNICPMSTSGFMGTAQNYPIGATFTWTPVLISNSPVNPVYIQPSQAEANLMSSWLNDASSQTPIFNQSVYQVGSFVYELEVSVGGCTNTDQIIISVFNPEFESIISGSFYSCMGECFTLNDDFNSSYTYEWSAFPSSELAGISDLTSPNPTFCPGGDVLYTLVLEDPESGCVSQLQSISVILEESFMIEDHSILICSYGENINLCELYENYELFDNPSWTFTGTSIEVESPCNLFISENTSFQLSVVNEFGCESLSTVQVLVEECDCDNVVMNFDGKDDRIITPSPLSGNSNYSISLDFKSGIQTNGIYSRLIGFTSFETEIAISGDELAYFNGNTWRNSGVNVADNQWHNVTLVRDGSTNHLYLDGILLSSLAAPGSLNFFDDLFIGGKSTGGSEFYEGVIDNVRIWDVALVEEDVCKSLKGVLGNEILIYNFEEGVGGNDNSALNGPLDLTGNYSGVFQSFSLMGLISNYICCETIQLECPSPCEIDSEPPLISCPVTEPVIPLVNGIFVPNVNDFNISATDECRIRYTYDPLQFSCEDLGLNSVTVTAIDQAGNSSFCNVSFILTDTDNYCVNDSCDNHVMNFDGVDDRVVTGSPLSGDANYTISLDFNWGGHSSGTYPRLIGFSGFMTEIAIRSSGELAFYNGSWRDSGTTVNSGGWHNITLRRNGSQYTLFLDGGVIYDMAGAATRNFSGQMAIGGEQNNSDENFRGSIDNVRVWDVALSDVEICNNVNGSSSNEVLYYDFEEGIGEGDNTSISGPIDQGSGNYDGTFSGFDLTGNISNYLCSEIKIQCTDPCVVDTTPPVCQAMDIIVPLNGNGAAVITPDMVDNGSYDECSEVSISIEGFNEFSCTDIGTQTAFLIVTDQSGNSSSCEFSITVEDNIAPICEVKDITITLDQSQSATISFADIDNGSSDNCNFEAVLSTTFFDCSNIGENIVTITLTDDNGNSSSCDAIVTIEDPASHCKDNSDCCGNSKLIGTVLNENSPIFKEVEGIRLLLSTREENGQTFAVITKLSSSNDVMWEWRMIEPSQLLDFTVNEDGNIIVVGRTTPVLVGQSNKCILGLLNGTTGSVINLRKYELFGRQTFTKIIKHPYPTKNPLFPFYITGVENGSPDNTNRHDDVILINIDDNLNINWARKYIKTDDNEWSRGILGLRNGDLLLTGNQFSGLKGVITRIDGDTGEEIEVLDTDNSSIFYGIDEDMNGNFISVGRLGSSSNAKGMICYHDNNLALRDLIHFDDQISNFYHLVKTSSNSYIAAGLMNNNKTALVEFSIVIDNIQIDNIKYIDQDGQSNSIANISGTNTELLFSEVLTDHPIGNPGNDIFISSLSFQLNEPCIQDTIFSTAQGSLIFTSRDLQREDLNIETDNNIILVSYANQCNDPCEDCISDTIPPDCQTMDIIVPLNGNGAAVITPAMVDNGSYDDCSEVSISIEGFNEFSCTDIGTQTAFLIVTDQSGNSSSCEFSITVEDNIAPICEVQDITIALDQSQSATISFADIDNGSSDNCDFDAELSTIFFDCSNIGENIVTITLTDDSGNSSSCDAIVTVEDTGEYCEMDTTSCMPYIVCELQDIVTDSCSLVLDDYTSNIAVFDSCCDFMWSRAPYAGDGHALAISQDGSLWGWGLNMSGALGLGNQSDQSSPILISNDIWKHGDVGRDHSIMIKSDGTLWTAGSNAIGNLGVQGISSSNTFIQVDQATNWEKAFAGQIRSYAIKSDGSLWRWGRTDNGDVFIPEQVGSDLNWLKVAYESYAIKNDGTLWRVTGTPTQVHPQYLWIDVAAAQGEGYAIRNDGTLWQWGTDPLTQIHQASDWKSIDAVRRAVYVQNTNGKIYSKGRGINGALGHGILMDSDTLVETLLPSNVIDFTAYTEGLFSFTSSGQMLGIGANSFNLLDDQNLLGKFPSPIEVHDCETENVTSEYSFMQSPAPGSVISEIATITIYTVDNSNSMVLDSCSFSITICDDPCDNDTTSPICITQNIVVSLDANGEAIITPDMIDNGSSDDCSEVSISIEGFNEFSCTDIGTQTAFLIVTDQSGNSSSCEFSIIVEDNIAPICEVQDITIALDQSQSATISFADIDNGSSDNCDFDAELSTTFFDCSNIGENTVTITITDDSGNSSSCDAIVTIEDPDLYCETSPIDCFKKVYRTDSIDHVREIFATNNSVYVVGYSQNANMVIPFLAKFSFTGTELWKFNLPDSIYLNDVVTNGASVYFVGQTPFSTGGYSIVGKVIDLGNNYSVEWINKYDHQYTFSNNTISNIADRAFNLFLENNMINVHCSASIPNSLPQESTLVLEIDQSGILINTYRYYYNGSSNRDPHFWRGFRKNKQNGFMIFGSNDDGGLGRPASFIYTDSNKQALETPLIQQIDFLYDGIELDDDKILLAGLNFIGIMKIDGTVYCSKTLNGMRGLTKLFGPYTDPNSGIEFFYGKGYKSLGSSIVDIICKFQVVNDCVVFEWFRSIDVDQYDSDSREGFISIPQYDQIIYSDSRLESGSQSNNDIFIGCFTETSCLLIDENIAVNDLQLTSFQDDFISTTYDNQIISSIESFVSSPFECVEIPDCDDPCDNDTTSPICITQNIVVSLDANGEAIISAEMIDNGSSDECGEVTLSIDRSMLNCNEVGENMVTLTVTDLSGNTSSCEAVVTVEDKLAPMCVTQDITINLDASGVASITADQIDNGSNDNCGYQLEIDKSSFTCDDLGDNVVTLTISDNQGNEITCTSIVTVQDINGNCPQDPCCQSMTDFLEVVEQSFQVYSSGCEVNVVSPAITECTEVLINWGDGSSDSFTGIFDVNHEYLLDGEYEICIEYVQRDSSGEICNSFTDCKTICVTCDQKCEEVQLIPLNGYNYPDYSRDGYINKHSDIQYYNDDLYAAFTQRNNDGSTSIHIWKNGSIVHTITNSIVTQVSEIKLFNDFIYLTGSFAGGDMLVPSIDNNDVTLFNNCYAAGNCLQDGFIIKYTLNFNLVWAFRVGGTWIDVVEDITIINENEFAITGTTRVEADFDPNDDKVMYSEDNNTIKGYTAKYSINENYDLPVCEWVNTLYTIDPAVSSVAGLGITHDDMGNIYAGGNYASGTAYGNTSSMELYSSTTSAPLPGFSVPANKYFGYVIQYKNDGALGWTSSLNNTGVGNFRNNYVSDLEIAGNHLYAVGLNTFAKYDLLGNLDNSLNINPVIEYGLDLHELAIEDDRLYIMGFVNDTYRNLDLMLPPGQGPQITSPLNFIFSIYDLDVNYIKSLNPGGSGVDYGTGITVQGDRIAISGNTSSEIFDAGHPGDNPNGIILNQISDRDFVIGEYTCLCESVISSEEGCCEDLTSILKEDESSDYCCGISIDNNQGVTISSIVVDLLGGAEFSNGQLDIDSDYVIHMSTASSIEITHTSGSIPTGTTSPLLEFCLDQDEGVINEYVVSYVQTDLSGNTYVTCRDTLNGDCGMEMVLNDCATISEISTVCLEGRDPYYEAQFTLTNESNSVIEELQLSGLPGGYSWSPCDIDPPIINTVLSVEIPPLPPGQSTQVCVRVVSNNPISMATTLDFIAVMIDEDGKSFCCAHDNSFELLPCCDDCEDIQIDLVEVSPCCYQFTMSGFCPGNDYRELNISTPSGVSIINSNVQADNGTIQPWILCDTGEGDLCIAPGDGVFTDEAGRSVVTFCLSGETNGIQDLSFEFRNDKSDVLCMKTENVVCDDGCIAEGFTNPVLVSLGIKNEQIILDCNQPPLILDCPEFSEVLIEGEFICPEGCESEVIISVSLDGKIIKPESFSEKGDKWGLILSDIVKNSGLYEITVQGSCDGVMSTCTYAFLVQEECDPCNCDNLVDDLALGWNINSLGKCEYSVSPNGLDTCDIVENWVIEGQSVNVPFDYNERVEFEINEPGSIEICMNVSRMGINNEICKESFCRTILLGCQDEDVLCENENVKNGNLDEGEYGSLNLYPQVTIPGWSVVSGGAFYFDSGGFQNVQSGYIRLVEYATKPIIETKIINPVIVSGSENQVVVHHDVYTRNDSTDYFVQLIIGTDTLSSDDIIPDRYIVDSRSTYFVINAALMDEIEMNGFKLQFGCRICEPVNGPDAYSFNFDNVCVEVIKNTTSTTSVDYSKIELKIWPNPTNNRLYFDYNKELNLHTVSIYSNLGEQISEYRLRNNMKYIDVSDLPGSLYFFCVKDQNGNILAGKRFIKI